MPSRTQYRSAAETAVCGGVGSLVGARLRSRWKLSEETLVVEGADIGAPEVGISVQDDARHEGHTIFFEQVFVFEEGIAHDLASGGAESVPAQDFWESRAQDWAVGAQPCDVETS